jgi:NTP pyrophosphatase (non-canonical NTP hydrolase)
MNFKDFAKHVSRTVDWQQPQKELTKNFCLGLAGEVGEVIEPIKKHLYHGKPLDINNFKKELGDVFWYVTALAIVNGIDVEQIVQENKAKLEARYPNGFKKTGEK